MFQKCFYFLNSCKYIGGAPTFNLVVHALLWRMRGRCATDNMFLWRMGVCATEDQHFCGACSPMHHRKTILVAHMTHVPQKLISFWYFLFFPFLSSLGGAFFHVALGGSEAEPRESLQLPRLDCDTHWP